MSTFHKKFIAMITVLVLTITLVGCGGTGSKPASADKQAQKGSEQNTGKRPDKKQAAKGPDSIQFPSGSVGGGYYQVAGILAKEFEPQLKIPVSVMPSGGSGENINLIEKGEVQMAVAASNTLWPAYTGTLQYKNKQYKNFRLVAKLYDNPTLFYALKKSGLESIKDLKGKRVGVGASPAAWDHITGPILEAHGISYDKDIKKLYVGFGDAATQVGDGLLDTTIANVGMPAIKQIASQKELSYLKFDEAAADQLAKKYPFYAKVIVEGSALPGYKGDKYVTIDIGGPYLVVNKDLPDEMVYQITKALYENIEKMSKNSTDLKEAAKNPARLATRLGEVPFHPGAEKFWKEKNLLKK